MPNNITDFDGWYAELMTIASKHGINVSDVSAWRESFDDGLSPAESLAEDYPECFAESEPYGMSLIDAESVAKAIDLPLNEWPGNCYAVACMMVDAQLLSGRPAYGHYLGKIDEKSMFYGKPIVHHGWIVTDDGDIVDPTRWVFESAEPYIYRAPAGSEYDEGGNVFRMKNERPAPPYSAEQAQKPIPNEYIPLVNSLLGRKTLQVTIGMTEAFWLANLSLISLGDHAKRLYLAMIEMGHRGFIPLDNRVLILGPDA